MKTARALLTNLATLLLSLILAFIIWLTATQTQNPTRREFLQLPVTFTGQPEEGILLTPAQQNVQVRIEGPDSVLAEITPDDFTARVDLSQAPFGETTALPVEVSTQVTDLTTFPPVPEEIEVFLERQAARSVPVELDIRGSTARGHTQGEPLIEPAQINVSGPASRLEQLDFALVTIFLNNARETTVTQQRPIFYDRQGRVASLNGLTLDQQDVTVTIPIEESAGFAEKLITVNWDGEPAPGYRLLSVTVEPPSVLVQGPPATISAMTRLRTEPIDVTGLTGTFTQQATLDLPEGVTLDQDQEIFVTIEIEPILTSDVRERDVELLGLDERDSAVAEPEQVRVVLFGPLPVLDTLLDSEVRVAVDLFGLDSGTHNITPTVTLPPRGLEVRSIQPSAITVTLTRTITSSETVTETAVLPRTLTLSDTHLQNINTHSQQNVLASMRFPVRLLILVAALPPAVWLRRRE